jgi:hypothetical protein
MTPDYAVVHIDVPRTSEQTAAELERQLRTAGDVREMHQSDERQRVTFWLEPMAWDDAKNAASDLETFLGQEYLDHELRRDTWSDEQGDRVLSLTVSSGIPAEEEVVDLDEFEG